MNAILTTGESVKAHQCAFNSVIEIDPDSVHENLSNTKKPSSHRAAFSLVEVILALGVAAFCLLVLLGLLPTGVKTQQSSIQQTTANQIISQIYSFLRADVRLPPGQLSKACGDNDPPDGCDWGRLSGHWRDRLTPDTLYFTNDAKQVALGGTPPASAVFRATITYRTPPTDTTALATIRVSWPAAVDPDPPNNGMPAGSVLATIAVNR
jgi:type II secretory pathway pseudopilin PulG